MSNETEARIPISRDNLPKVIAKAYELSKPQGMGYLHFQEGGIPEDVLQKILSRSDAEEGGYHKRVSLDYVQGRAVKLSIPYDEETGEFYISGDRWYDHSGSQWDELTDYASSLQA